MWFTKKVNGAKVAQFESIGKLDTPHLACRSGMVRQVGFLTHLRHHQRDW
jgi:hypothetical protein